MRGLAGRGMTQTGKDWSQRLLVRRQEAGRRYGAATKVGGLSEVASGYPRQVIWEAHQTPTAVGSHTLDLELPLLAWETWKGQLWELPTFLQQGCLLPLEVPIEDSLKNNDQLDVYSLS